MQLETSKIYFLGIGGIGMSGIAELLHNMGAKVWGSDLGENANTERLKALGIEVFKGHRVGQIGDADVVVYSSAISPSHIELVEAKEKKIPRIPRAEALAEIMRLKRGIAIAGSHGKTTTTSLIASVLIGGGLKPTIVVGGRLDLIKSTSQLGSGNWLVAEADESDGSFLKLKPEISVITNIDNDHMDFYASDSELEKAFRDFALQVPFYGKIFACGDDERLRRALDEFPKNVVYYGFDDSNDYQLSGENGKYDVYHGGEKIFDFEIHFPGKHYALNSLAAILVGIETGLDRKVASDALQNFSGVGRRFERKGEYQSCDIYDDYAHHPTEIRATISAFKEKFPDKKLKIAFQPHRYSRTKLCWDDFTHCFEGVDELYLLPIYAAGEKPMEGVSEEALLDKINLTSKQFFKDQDSLYEFLKINLNSEEIFVTFGAGNIFQLGVKLVES